MDCSTPGFPVHHQLPELIQIHVCWVSDAIQPSHPLSSPSPPTFNLSQHQGLFQWVGFLHQVAKVQYPGLISVRIDWFDLLAVQGTFTSHLQHHSSKASILRHSTFFMGSIPGLGRSPGEGNGNPLQNFMNRGVWWTIVRGVTKSRTRLSNHTFPFTSGPVVNNLTCNARDRGLIPGPGTKNN